MSKSTKDQIVVEGDDRTPQITESVARHVLHYFGDHVGRDGGGFATSLLQAIAHADQSNLAKLQVAFPDYVFAFLTIRDKSWGLNWLRTKVMDAAVAA
jgi:hypothetical protein